MRKELPTFDNLIERLCACVKLRNPKEYDEQHSQTRFRSAWFGKDKQLYELVKKLEQEEHKTQSYIEKHDIRVNEFILGVDILNNPIICKHEVLFVKKSTKWSGRYSKKGSENIWSSNYGFIGSIFKQW